ncbi:hypothetical protein FA13DRAFT_1090580 [Coprinellus micaceus]|uniref:Uncharacterized protein n=1 Tax=Coprinellus micaceus TaxID=71717 RepID=A0A4Y7TTL2_COPMI|nr:hypothetical protein FA13DRAFT_1090580 [Coprinellus micaceus]
MGNDLRYPVSPPAGELGYPCFIPSDASEQRSKDEASQIGNDIRSYLRLTATIILLIVALIVFFIEYGRQKGRIIQVIRRDAGLCYLTVTGTHGFLLQYGTM